MKLDWSAALVENAAEEATARRLITQLGQDETRPPLEGQTIVQGHGEGIEQ